MRTFSPVEAIVATADAANIAGTESIPQTMVFADLAYWAEQDGLESTAGEPEEGTEATIASKMLDYAIDTQNLCSSHVLRSMLPELSGPEDEQSSGQDPKETVAARYAFSRLVGGLSLGGGVASDALSPYEATPQEKLIFDLESATHGACAVIVDRSRLRRAPFEGEPLLKGGGQWYLNEELGLYVLASPDVSVSQGTLDQLALGTGSQENALRLIDAPNSVALRPYVSLRYLERGPQ